MDELADSGLPLQDPAETPASPQRSWGLPTANIARCAGSVSHWPCPMGRGQGKASQHWPATTCSPLALTSGRCLQAASASACRNPSRKTFVTSGFMGAESELSVSEPAGDLTLLPRAVCERPFLRPRSLSPLVARSHYSYSVNKLEIRH